MLMTLSHCVVRTFFVLSTGSPEGGGPAAGVSSAVAAYLSLLFAMMLCASTKASRTCFLFSAIALLAAARFGFFALAMWLAFVKSLVGLSRQVVVSLNLLCRIFTE